MARSTFKAVIDGGGRGTAVTMSKILPYPVSRFETVRLVFFLMVLVVRLFCRIVKNWQTGIIVVRQLPLIEDNIIASIVVLDFKVGCTSTNASINHNSIAFNGNHGVAIGGNSEIILENNVVAFNERFGLKILSSAERIQVTNNNFYRNLPNPRPVPSGNFSFDPAFMSPRTKLDFKSDPYSCKAKGTDDQEPGSRITY